MATQEATDLEEFRFRDLHPGVWIGMASDRFAGWVGQIYSEGRHTKGMNRRIHTVGGKPFVEETLPVESVGEYFEHFPVLEIDYTFYRPLLDSDGEPTQSYHVLREYSRYLKEGDHLVLKVPQIICAQKLWRGKAFVPNEFYLSADLFTNQFYEPAVKLLGSSLSGFIFEQEYQRKSDRVPAAELAETFNVFFGSIPKDKRYHVELRTEAYLSEPVFGVLEKHGVGLVLSHWTWLPPLEKQFEKTGRRFFNGDRQSIVRLITPLRMTYEESYAKAFPFTQLIEGMLDSRMIEETVRLLRAGIEQGLQMTLIINNRAGGNGPIIATLIARRFLGLSA